MSALGYIFIFYVGFYFYRLAENHNKNKWAFGILGIVTYLFGTLLYPLYLRIFNSDDIEVFDMTSMILKSFLIGFLTIFILFQILSFIWSKKGKEYKNDLDKIGK